ncbi:MAG: AlpA family phage regulatory protein [Proteobacteria bacterium]|nr:AlpA family phage regulatory protein [Desulfobacula sp.]MBU3951011.1 AlpA family phage regulatory protein [Pseudomonadota bacterium]MBU4131579.1 AlpA family phage regulatory protein [Pseudomonadota bacterium]
MVYLSDKQIAKKFGVHRTTIWRWVKSGNFPKPLKLSVGCTRWPEKPVQDWESKRVEAH